MILFWCLLGIALAIGIARYNQSNKLFWILFTSFVIGIAGASVYNKIVTPNNQTESTQVYPTQEYSGSNSLVTIEPEYNMCAITPNLVSQDYTPEHNGLNLIVEDVHLAVQTPPPQV